MTKHQAPNNFKAPSTKQIRITKSKTVKLYTKSGDGGESGLGDGRRLSKSDLVFEVLGGIDEVNSLIGWVNSEVARVVQVEQVAQEKVQKVWKVRNVRKELMKIQNTLLVVGAVVSGGGKVKLAEEEIRFLEERIDWYQGQLGEEWYKQFLLPGGTELAARIDVARSVCRRVERVWARFKIYDLRFKNEKQDLVGRYLNRMSDYLFALRCYVNWVQGFGEKKFVNK